MRKVEREEIVQLIKEMRESQEELRVVRAVAEARRKANARQDGLNGFIMVDTK